MVLFKNLNSLNYRYKTINFFITNKTVNYNFHYLQPIYIIDKLIFKNISTSSIFNFMFSYNKNFFFINNSRYLYYIRTLLFLYNMNTSISKAVGNSGTYNRFNSNLIQTRRINFFLI